jgi:hypothetical protein
MHAGNEESRRSVAFLIAATVILLPVFYVLAIGPAHWCMDHGYLGEPTFDAIYGPFIAVVKRSPPVQNILVWYIDLWVKS